MWSADMNTDTVADAGKLSLLCRDTMLCCFKFSFWIFSLGLYGLVLMTDTDSSVAAVYFCRFYTMKRNAIRWKNGFFQRRLHHFLHPTLFASFSCSGLHKRPTCLGFHPYFASHIYIFCDNPELIKALCKSSKFCLAEATSLSSTEHLKSEYFLETWKAYPPVDLQISSSVSLFVVAILDFDPWVLTSDPDIVF